MKRAISTLLVLFFSLTIGQMAAAQDQRPYSSVRGWDVFAGFQNNAFIGCGMERPSNRFDLSLFQSQYGEWELAFPANYPAGQQVQIDMDLDRYSDVLYGVSDGQYAAVLTTPDWVQGFAQGNRLYVTIGGYGYDVSLHGTAAAILKVEECTQYGGNSPARANPVTRPAAPVQNGGAIMGQDCPAYGTYRSPDVQDWGDVQFFNHSQSVLTLYWIDYNGNNVEMGNLQPGAGLGFTSNGGHHWIAKDYSGRCYGGVHTLGVGENQINLF